MTTEDATIFVVDDDESVRDSLQLLLETDGFKVRAYESAVTFLNAECSSARGCIVLDVKMPEMDGLELLDRLKARNNQLPVIMVTGHGDVPMAVRAMKIGALDFIEKPFTDDVLLECVSRAIDVCDKNQTHDESVAEINSRISRLTPREHDVLVQLVIGRPNKLIACELGISPRTVEIHRARVMEKMNTRSLSELVRMAILAGLAPDPI